MKHSVIASVVVCGVLLSSCQRKAEGQTVAVVNGQEVTLPELNFTLSQAKVPESADKDAVRSQLLQQLVDRKLLVEQARSEGIDAPEGEVVGEGSEAPDGAGVEPEEAPPEG